MIGKSRWSKAYSKNKVSIRNPDVFCPIEFLRPNPDVEVYEVPVLLGTYFFESD